MGLNHEGHSVPTWKAVSTGVPPDACTNPVLDTVFHFTKLTLKYVRNTHLIWVIRRQKEGVLKHGIHTHRPTTWEVLGCMVRLSSKDPK